MTLVFLSYFITKCIKKKENNTRSIHIGWFLSYLTGKRRPTLRPTLCVVRLVSAWFISRRQQLQKIVVIITFSVSKKNSTERRAGVIGQVWKEIPYIMIHFVIVMQTVYHELCCICFCAHWLTHICVIHSQGKKSFIMLKNGIMGRKCVYTAILMVSDLTFWDVLGRALLNRLKH